MEKTLKSVPPLWWLREISQIDLILPGTAGHLLGRSSDHRRQCAAAALAALATRRQLSDQYENETGVCGDDPAFARSLTKGRLHSMITDAYGACPAGYLGYLKRMGSRIAPPRVYQRLHILFSNPLRVEATRALQRIAEPRDEIIAIAEDCPDWILRTGILQELRNVSQREALLDTINLISAVCPTATQSALAESLRAAARSRDLGRFVERWLSCAVFPKADFEFDPIFIHVGNARDLSRLAYRNCLKSHRTSMIAGLAMLFRCELHGTELLVLLCRNDPDSIWELSDIRERENKMPSYERSTIVKDRLLNCGVRIPRQVGTLPAQFQAIDLLVRPDFLDDFDDWLPG